MPATKKTETTQKSVEEDTRTGAILNEAYDAAIARFKSFDLGDRRQKMGVVEDANLVRNVPADRTCTWAVDPAVDNGRHLEMITELGYRPVRADEVTRDPTDLTKMFLPFYTVLTGELVARGGGVLMIGYKQYRDERREKTAQQLRQDLERTADSFNSVGVKPGDPGVQVTTEF